jgi:hypothetical protein
MARASWFALAGRIGMTRRPPAGSSNRSLRDEKTEVAARDGYTDPGERSEETPDSANRAIGDS